MKPRRARNGCVREKREQHIHTRAQARTVGGRLHAEEDKSSAVAHVT